MLDESRGNLLLARSYRIRVAQGLTQASGMHTCLQTSRPLNKWPYPSVSRGEAGGQRNSARTCITPLLPLPKGELEEEGGRQEGWLKCHRCGLEGCKGHRGDEVPKAI